MPLYPNGPRLGIGLWNSVAGTMTVELGLFGLGVALYMRATRAHDAVGKLTVYIYVMFLIVAYFSDRFGGTPSSVKGIVVTSIIAEAILIATAGWIDSHRGPVVNTRDWPG